MTKIEIDLHWLTDECIEELAFWLEVAGQNFCDDGDILVEHDLFDALTELDLYGLFQALRCLQALSCEVTRGYSYEVACLEVAGVLRDYLYGE